MTDSFDVLARGSVREGQGDLPPFDGTKIRPGWLGAFGMAEMEDAAEEIASICREHGTWAVDFNMHFPSGKSPAGFAHLAHARLVEPSYPNSRWCVTREFVARVQSPTGWRHDGARNQWVPA